MTIEHYVSADPNVKWRQEVDRETPSTLIVREDGWAGADTLYAGDRARDQIRFVDTMVQAGRFVRTCAGKARKRTGR